MDFTLVQNREGLTISRGMVLLGGRQFGRLSRKDSHMDDVRQYLYASDEELERLSPLVRKAVKQMRYEARERKFVEHDDLPTKDELHEIDVRLGLRVYDDVSFPVYIKDNYATRYNPETKTYSRGDRSVKPVMGEASERKLEQPTGRDQAHNRYLQSQAPVAQGDFNKYRFLVMQLRSQIVGILKGLGRGDVIALMNGGDFEALDEAIKTLPADAIYGRDEDMSITDLFGMMRACAIKRNKAERALDLSPQRPRAAR